jgi:hypothetical protein
MMRKSTGTVYRIVVRSELSDRYAVAFEGMEMETKNGDTILTGGSSTSRTSTASSIA